MKTCFLTWPMLLLFSSTSFVGSYLGVQVVFIRSLLLYVFFLSSASSFYLDNYFYAGSLAKPHFFINIIKREELRDCR